MVSAKAVALLFLHFNRFVTFLRQTFTPIRASQRDADAFIRPEIRHSLGKGAEAPSASLRRAPRFLHACRLPVCRDGPVRRLLLRPFRKNPRRDWPYHLLRLGQRNARMATRIGRAIHQNLRILFHHHIRFRPACRTCDRVPAPAQLRPSRIARSKRNLCHPHARTLAPVHSSVLQLHVRCSRPVRDRCMPLSLSSRCQDFTSFTDLKLAHGCRHLQRFARHSPPDQLAWLVRHGSLGLVARSKTTPAGHRACSRLVSLRQLRLRLHVLVHQADVRDHGEFQPGPH